MRTRRGGVREVGGRKYMRIRIGKKQRETIPIVGCKTDEEIVARCALIADITNELVAGGRRDKVKDIAVQLGAARTAGHIAAIRKAVALLIEHAKPLRGDDLTIRQWAHLWTSGELHRLYPDYVKKKSSANVDIGILERHILPHVGDVPLRAFTLDHGELVMAKLSMARTRLGNPLGPAMRRHVAQVLQTLMRLAVFPARRIPVSPLPPRWLPRLSKPKALTYLYADEDARLLASGGEGGIPLFYRLLYGIYVREGFRCDELLDLEWTDLDLARGVVRLDENKTSDPRSWAMSPGVTNALKAWKENVGTSHARVFGGRMPTDHLAVRLRAHLKVAGIDRPELFERSEIRQPLRVHDLRGTFVTLSLAAGKTESWVQDRTGHRSTLMIARYRRVARTVEELGHAPPLPLDQAIPELRGGANGGQTDAASEGSEEEPTEGETVDETGTCSPPGTRTRTSRRTGDFKLEGTASNAVSMAEESSDPGEEPPPRAGMPHGMPHPILRAADGLALERVSWDLFDLYEAEAVGIELPRARGGR